MTIAATQTVIQTEGFTPWADLVRGKVIQPEPGIFHKVFPMAGDYKISVPKVNDSLSKIEQFVLAGNYTAAVAACRALVASHPSEPGFPRDPDLLHLLGSLLAASGEIEEALDTFDRAIEVRLFHVGAHTDLCTVLAYRGKATGRYRISVVTPSIGTVFLARAIESVQMQTRAEVEHVIFIDGPQGAEAAERVIPSNPRHPIHLIKLPFNTGGGGFGGFRIYGAAPFLVTGRYVAFLDEDNTFEPNHLSRMMDLIEINGLQWAHSLRTIVDEGGQVITKDDCESLGRWHAWYDSRIHVIDASCYLIRRDLLISASPSYQWRFRDQGGSPDIFLGNWLMKNAPIFGCSGEYSVRYLVGRTERSVKTNFFTDGNKAMHEKYGNESFPWAKPTITPAAYQRGAPLVFALSPLGNPMLKLP